MISSTMSTRRSASCPRRTSVMIMRGLLNLVFAVFSCMYSVFCNRSVSLQHIKSYGFDMDYTLAVYHVRLIVLPTRSCSQSPALDILAYDLSVQRLLKLGVSVILSVWMMPKVTRLRLPPSSSTPSSPSVAFSSTSCMAI